MMFNACVRFRGLFLALAFGLCLAPAMGADGDKVDLKKLPAAADKDDADAQFYLGTCYYTGKGIPQNLTEAVKWFRKAAERNNADAQYHLGLCLANGQGVEQDAKAGAEWIRRASENGNLEATDTLALMYSNGNGVKKDYDEAVRLFRRASEAGHNESRKNLALCYYNGYGVKQDYKEAVRLLAVAAEAGSAEAQYTLGVCYVNACGVDKDYAKAIKWLKLAVQNGHIDAEGTLAEALDGHARERAFSKWAMDKGLAFGETDDQGRTLAHFAVRENRPEILEWLGENGDELDAQDDNGVTPVDMAVADRREAMVTWFEDAAGIASRDMKAELAWVGNMRAAGADEREVMGDALSLMCRAAGSGDVKGMKALAGIGVNVNASLEDGTTPLHSAVHAENRQSIKWLKGNGADIRIRDNRDFTPMDYARARKQGDVIGWLVGY